MSDQPFPPTPTPEPEDRDPSAERRAQSVAGVLGTDPAQLMVLGEAEWTLVHSGVTARFYKVFDPGSGRSARVALDGSDQPLDVDAILQAETDAARRRYGAMQPALSDLLDSVAATDRRIPALIRYRVSDDDELDKLELDGRVLDDDAVAEIGRRVARRNDAIAEQTSAVHAQTMRDLGVEPADPAPTPTGPFVAAVLAAPALRALARDERVLFVGPDAERAIPDHPTTPESLPLTRTDTAHASEFRGNGVRIGVLEDGSPDVAAVHFRIAATQDATQPANAHMTKSLGIIGNDWSGRWEGYAPDARILLANADDYRDRYRWARDRNVNVVTMSWHFGSEETDGALHSRDVFFDHMALRWPYPTVFTSAGNDAEDGAFASGKGYNIVGVGNVLNEEVDRCEATIASSSSWKNPTTPHGDHEVPAIAAPGSRHELLGGTFGGTSCATPVAASIAAVLMSRNPRLTIWPEAIRAIMLATANQQDADAATYSPNRDGKDGAGLVNTQYGVWTAGRREPDGKPQFRAHDYGGITHADFADGYLDRTWTARVSTTRSRIRVALAWNSRTTGTGDDPSASILDADLDLHVFGPDGTLVAAGIAWDNSWEMVEFHPRQAGLYTIKVRGFRVPRSFASWFGVAWTAHYDLC